jgi:hypothetical protein
MSSIRLTVYTKTENNGRQEFWSWAIMFAHTLNLANNVVTRLPSAKKSTGSEFDYQP